MENLIFSLNATVPVFLLMLLGLLFRKIGWIDEVFALKMNRFVFLVPLPVKVFQDLAAVEFEEAWNAKFVIFCFAVTIFSIAISAAFSFLWKDRTIQGEFIQASYRSSAALLGIAFIQNIYGNSGMAPMMIIGSVPLYNIMAVVILSFFGRERRGIDKELLVKTLKGIVTNPIIIGIVIGILWSAFNIPLPKILEKTVSNVASVATPMGLMAMGATFDIRKAFGKIKPAFAATFLKLVGLCAVFLPIAIHLGFRNSELVAILVMLGSATTVSCFVMSKNMGHKGVLSSSVVMLTTMFSAFTLTGWLYILKSMMLI
ncbi:MAG: AEC family transporter [Schaedlerella sp.]|nr:AEC family transporter [Schaedlerella sp.]